MTETGSVSLSGLSWNQMPVVRDSTSCMDQHHHTTGVGCINGDCRFHFSFSFFFSAFLHRYVTVTAELMYSIRARVLRVKNQVIINYYPRCPQWVVIFNNV